MDGWRERGSSNPQEQIDRIDRPLLTPLLFLSSVSPTTRGRWRATIPISKTDKSSLTLRGGTLARELVELCSCLPPLKFVPSPSSSLSSRRVRLVEQTMVRLVESFSADFRFSLFFFSKKRTHARANSTRCDCCGTRRETKRMKTLRCTSPHVPVRSATFVAARRRSANHGAAPQPGPSLPEGRNCPLPPAAPTEWCALLSRMHTYARDRTAPPATMLLLPLSTPLTRICERTMKGQVSRAFIKLVAQYNGITMDTNPPVESRRGDGRGREATIDDVSEIFRPSPLWDGFLLASWIFMSEGGTCLA